MADVKWLLIWSGLILGSALFALRGKRVWAAPPILGLVLLALQVGSSPGWKLLCASLLFLYLMKSAVLLKLGTRLPVGRALLYFSVWPGMDPRPVAERGEPGDASGKLFLRGLLSLYAGGLLALGLALAFPRLPVAVVSWLGIAALLLIIHFGLSRILSALVQLAGVPVEPLFDNPLASKSLRDFWTRRWNRPFVEMDRILFLGPLTRRFGIRGAVFGVFLISGLLHEMAISYPAEAGWGMPLAYFALQGALTLLEPRKGWGRAATWLLILVPLPLLFHAPFRMAFIVPLFSWLHGVIASLPLSGWIDLLLWALGIAHFLVLIASFQVPFRLRWREELPALSSFNRKLVWTLGGFTTMSIAGFGTFTLALHQELLRGDRAALAVGCYIVLFWCTRILVDLFYYEHSDWPKGPQFFVGHALLNSLFAFLILGYGSVLLYHAL